MDRKLPLTSRSLLMRVRDRANADAWVRLTDVYNPLIRRWLRPYLLQPADSDDLVQEVFTTLARELPSFELQPRPGAFRCWLRMITVHRLRAYWQARDRRPDLPGRDAMSAALD